MESLNTREALLDAVRELREELDRVIQAAGEDRMEQPGSFGEWTSKDVVAHLTGWRLVTAAPLEAGRHGGEPEFLWPSHFDESNDLHDINRWFYETKRDKPLAEILRESQATFERVEHAIATMPEDAMLLPDRFPWLHRTHEPLGPAVVRGSQNHYHVEHEPAIRAWLGRG